GDEGTLTGVATGYHDLDRQVLGLQPSTLNIVPARPRAGKNAVMLCEAANVAMESRRPVLFFSMEMSAVELTKRMLASESRVDARKLQTGKLTDGDWTRINTALRTLS